MDHSTENVTLQAVFITDVLKNYEDSPEDYRELFAMVKDTSLSDPGAYVPISLYNDLCSWIEKNLGKFNLIEVGRLVGETVYSTLIEQKKLSPERLTPLKALEGLVVMARELIHDPKQRGWEILEVQDYHIIIRRTQTFNSKLQLGVLSGLVRKANVQGVNVAYEKSLDQGDEFDDYRISWM